MVALTHRLNVLFSKSFAIKNFLRYNFTGSDGGVYPCNPDGGSPSMFKDKARFTSLLLTLRNLHHVRLCGLNSANSKDAHGVIPHGVEQSGAEKFTKAHTAILLFSPGNIAAAGGAK